MSYYFNLIEAIIRHEKFRLKDKESPRSCSTYKKLVKFSLKCRLGFFCNFSGTFDIRFVVQKNAAVNVARNC